MIGCRSFSIIPVDEEAELGMADDGDDDEADDEDDDEEGTRTDIRDIINGDRCTTINLNVSTASATTHTDTICLIHRTPFTPCHSTRCCP